MFSSYKTTTLPTKEPKEALGCPIDFYSPFIYNLPNPHHNLKTYQAPGEV